MIGKHVMNREDMRKAIEAGQTVSFGGRLIKHVNDLPAEHEVATSPAEIRAALAKIDKQHDELEVEARQLRDKLRNAEISEQANRAGERAAIEARQKAEETVRQNGRRPGRTVEDLQKAGENDKGDATTGSTGATVGDPNANTTNSEGGENTGPAPTTSGTADPLTTRTSPPTGTIPAAKPAAATSPKGEAAKK